MQSIVVSRWRGRDQDTSLPAGIRRVSFAGLVGAIEDRRPEVLSIDLFDTLLLRDHTIESERLARACRRAAGLLGVDPDVLTRLRWSFHDSAYRAVAIERPEGEASLAGICRAVTGPLGLDADAARVLHTAEVDTDIEHLRPHRRLLDVLERADRRDVRVIAVSDTYYDGADLQRMIDTVVGATPIAAVYSSADLGLTKHAGRIFDEVARREGTAADRILHVGDNRSADVRMARTADWTALYMPRARRHRVGKAAGKLLALGTAMRRTG